MTRSSKNIVWRLLRRNISVPRILGYALANLVGLVIVITALQFYLDVRSVWSADDSGLGADHIIISKKVEALDLISTDADANRFSPREMEELRSQSWVDTLAGFTSADFNVYARVDAAGSSMGSELFLEAVPEEFMDEVPRDWGYKPGESQYVPVVLSKDYLSLYNFGFASARGLPQVPESIVGMVPIRMSLSGAGKQQWLQARVVGFSKRINTIAVPEEFMAWANGEFGEPTASTAPSRLIIRLSTPGSPDIEPFLAKHGYETAGDKSANGKAAFFLSLVTTIVIAIGLIISALAFFILLLSIYLLLQKNREKIHNLMLLGYTPAAVSRYYIRIVVGTNIAVLLVAVAAMAVASCAWRPMLESLGVTCASLWVSIGAAVAVTAVITLGNTLSIRRKVRSSFR